MMDIQSLKKKRDLLEQELEIINKEINKHAEKYWYATMGSDSVIVFHDNEQDALDKCRSLSHIFSNNSKYNYILTKEALDVYSIFLGLKKAKKVFVNTWKASHQELLDNYKLIEKPIFKNNNNEPN